MYNTSLPKNYVMPVPILQVYSFFSFTFFSRFSCLFCFIWNKPYLPSGYHCSMLGSIVVWSTVSWTVSSLFRHDSGWHPWESNHTHMVTPHTDFSELKRLQIHSQEPCWRHITTIRHKGDKIICFRSFQNSVSSGSAPECFVALLMDSTIVPSKVQRSNHHGCGT